MPPEHRHWHQESVDLVKKSLMENFIFCAVVALVSLLLTLNMFYTFF